MAGARLLLVTNDPAAGQDVQRQLARLGYAVCAAADSVDNAVRQVEEARPDLVLIDASGAPCQPDAVEQIRARFHVPTLFLFPDVAGDSVPHAALDTLVTPLTERQVHAAVEFALYRHRAEQQSREAERRYQEVQRAYRADQGRLQQEIEQRRRVEAALRQRSLELALHHRTAQTLNSTLDLDRVLGIVLEEVRHLLSADACSVWLLDPEGGALIARQTTGAHSELVHGQRLALGEGLAGWIAQNGKSLVVPDARVDARHFTDIDRQTRMELRSIVGVPMQVKDRTIGVLQVLDKQVDRFGPADLLLLEPLAASAATAIENAQLYEETERLRAFNENMVQSMEEGIVLLDAAGQITFCNRRASELLAYPRADLIGRLWATLLASGHVPEAGQNGIPLSCTIPGQHERVLLTRSGHRLPVLIGNRPLLENGEFAGALVVFTDITEHKRAEEALKRQNRELAALNAIATTISQSLDLDRILEAALDKVLEMIRMDAGWIQLIDPDSGGSTLSLVAHRGITDEMVRDLDRVQVGQGLIGRVIRTREYAVIAGGSQDGELYVPGMQSQATWTLGTIPIQARETVLGVLSVLSRMSMELDAHDLQILAAIGHQIGMAVENLRLLEQASQIHLLRELDRFRSELIANVSHELRTPLGLIKIFCTTLMRKDVDFDRSTQLEFLHDIEQETDRLEEIVSNLLDVSRMDSGRLHLDRRSTDLGQLATEVMEEMERQLTRHRFVHRFDEPLVVSADRKRLAQVFRNLLSNAIKYSPRGGEITVRGYRDRGHVTVQVRDRGIGIPKANLETVFERFYRVDNETTRSVGGVGLGLAVCQGIVEAHGGRIWVESTVGEGSTFSFALPAVAVTEVDADPSLDPEQPLAA